MQFKRLQKTFRRQLKVQQKQVEFFSSATEKSIERNVFGRFERLKPVRRFIAGWVALLLLVVASLVAQFQHLSAYYQTVQPIDGGIYSEGIVGTISNVNPIYATSDADRSLSRLMFSGLLGYDKNGALVPVLAEKYEVTDNGRLYTVTIKQGLTWHDGQSFDSGDVLFTYNTIKNPDALSPLLATWKNVTIAAPDPQTVTFKLPTTLASFPYSMTTGLIPEHILSKVTGASMRSTDFNTTKPIGTGPFQWRGLEVTGNTVATTQEQVALVPFSGYSAGQPKLSEFIMRIYGSKEGLEQAFADGQLSAAVGLDSIPAGSPKNTESRNLLLKAGTYVFFKTTNPVLSSVKVRQALVAASDPQQIIDKLDYMTRAVNEPLLVGQLSYNKEYAQKTNDVTTAKKLLAEDGWTTSPNGTLSKASQPLKFRLVLADTPEYRNVAEALKQQWKEIGAAVDVQYLAIADYSTALADHDYDATLYGISIGEDPDVYAYWDSSQADIRSATRLNLSEWKNTTADQALQAGRTRIDADLRTVKYAPFLQAWQQDAPALGLYQPRFQYITRSQVYGLTDKSITGNVDRYNGIENWQIRSARVTNSK